MGLSPAQFPASGQRAGGEPGGNVFMEFKEIVGEYSNKNQAFMYPCNYAMIRLVWKDLGENKLQSQSFYEYDYPKTDPYRQSYHTYEMITDEEVLLRSFDMDWNPTCDHNIYWNGAFWVAKTCGECIVKDIRIESEFKFNREKCFSRDAGYDESGKLVWGKDSGLFEFDRVI
jgi:hypothetical protein